jgi:hypothetical protein
LAGWQASREKRELEVIQRAGIKHRCFSFANLYKIKGFPYYISGFEGSYQQCLKNGVGIMLDSGIVSYRGYKAFAERTGKDISKLPCEEEFVELYVAYVKEHQKKWKFFVTMDLLPKAPIVWKWHKKLEAHGLRPTPVFHGDVDISYLERYVDKGYKYICIGGNTIRRSGDKRAFAHYLDSVFNFGAKHGISWHGLAMTSPWVMMTWPWYSVDSSWWSRSAGYGSIMRWNDTTERMSILHISPRISKAQAKDALFKANKVAMQRLKEELKEEGFDLDLLRESYVERHVYNAKTMLRLAESATKRQRGSWNLLF